MVFNTIFNSISDILGSQCTYPCFPGVLLTSTPHNILSKPLTAFPQNHCETTDRGERGMNPVAMTIINPLKGYWPSRGSNQQPPVLKSTTLPTELWGSASSTQGETVVKGYSIIPKNQKFWLKSLPTSHMISVSVLVKVFRHQSFRVTNISFKNLFYLSP